jgi:hypothetical protein
MNNTQIKQLIRGYIQEILSYNSDLKDVYEDEKNLPIASRNRKNKR